jgi:hypothetical protein
LTESATHSIGGLPLRALEIMVWRPKPPAQSPAAFPYRLAIGTTETADFHGCGRRYPNPALSMWALFSSFNSRFCRSPSAITLGIAFAEVFAVITTAHAIKARFAVIGTPASAGVFPSYAVSITIRRAIHRGYLPGLYMLGHRLRALRLNTGQTRQSWSARKAQRKSQRKCKLFDFPEGHSSPLLSESIQNA